MIAFEIHVNGDRVCTAGVGELGVLSSILTWRGHQPFKDGAIPSGDSLVLDVGGLTIPEGKHVRWTELSLRVGDEVRIKVLRPHFRTLPAHYD